VYLERISASAVGGSSAPAMYGPQQRRIGEPLPQGQDGVGARVDMAAIIRHFMCLSQARWIFRICGMATFWQALSQLQLKIAEYKWNG